MKYIYQSVDDLVLQYIEGNFDTSALNVIKTYNINFNSRYNIELAIIGASHYISIKNKKGERLLTEVFACLELKLENTIRIFPNFNVHKDSCTLPDKILEYSVFSTYTEKINSLDLNYFKKHNDLTYSFKSMNELDATTAIIFTKNSEDSFHIKTLHSYPNENKLVITGTNFNLKKEKS